MEIRAPVDIVSPLIEFLRANGVDHVSSVIPRERKAGMVRVTRIGGQPINEIQDKAMILIEVWDTSSLKSWNTAMRLWALFAAVQTQDAISGLTCYKVTPSVPVQQPDEYAPDLDRQQFTVEILAKMMPYRIG